MKNPKIKIISVIILVVVFSISYFIYNSYYKIDVSSFSYFLTRLVESPDKQYSVKVDILKNPKENHSAYIMGTLGIRDEGGGYSIKSIIFWQKVDSSIIKEKTINGEVMYDFLIDADWVNEQTININGIQLNINDAYDYRRDRR